MSAESVKLGKPPAPRLAKSLRPPAPRSTVRPSPITPTASMLSFCRSFNEVDRWVASALSKITSALSLAKLKPPRPVSGEPRSAKALACASLISKDNALGKPMALVFEADMALSKVVRSAVAPSTPAVLSCSMLIESMPLAAKLSKLAVRLAVTPLSSVS